MFTKPACPIIAIEEHYWDPELTKHYTGVEASRGSDTNKRLLANMETPVCINSWARTKLLISRP